MNEIVNVINKSYDHTEILDPIFQILPLHEHYQDELLQLQQGQKDAIPKY